MRGSIFLSAEICKVKMDFLTDVWHEVSLASLLYDNIYYPQWYLFFSWLWLRVFVYLSHSFIIWFCSSTGFMMLFQLVYWWIENRNPQLIEIKLLLSRLFDVIWIEEKERRTKKITINVRDIRQSDSLLPISIYIYSRLIPLENFKTAMKNEIDMYV